MRTMKAFHSNETIKTRLIAQLQAHYEADEIVQGQYWEEGKGCAVGCTVHSGKHAQYETLYGIPEVVAHLEEAIFEGLPAAQAKEFPIRFVEAIAPGADLALVWPRFAIWLLVDPDFGVVRLTTGPGKPAVENVAKLHQRICDGETVSAADWNAARAAARAARAAAPGWITARAAVAAGAAAEAARSAAPGWITVRTAAVAAVAVAAVAAANAWAAANAANAWKEMSDKLLALLKEAK